MTTTVAFRCKGGVVLASDSRATMRSYIASVTAKKIYQINEKMALTTAGMVGDAQVLARIVSVEVDDWEMKIGIPMSVKAAATSLSFLLNQRKFYPYEVQLILGGVDNDGTSHIFSLDLAGGITEEDVTATGSGSPVAAGALEVLLEKVLEQEYSEDMSVENGKKLAAKAIAVAKSKDSATGNAIQVVAITQEGYEVIRLVSEEEIKDYIKDL